MNWFPHSLRWRIQLWHGLLLLVVIVAFCFASYRLQREETIRHADGELDLRLTALTNALQQGGRQAQGGGPPNPAQDGAPGEPPPPGAPAPGGPPTLPRSFQSAELTSLFDLKDPNPFYYVVWSRRGEVLGGADADFDRIPRPATEHRGLTRITRDRPGVRELYVVTPPGECLLVGRSVRPIDRELNHTLLRFIALGSAVLGLGWAGGWWLSSRAIRPIADISHAATRIATGQLSERIHTDEGAGELGELARVLNDTFARLEAAFAEQARFTSDAAHELRTPVSVILAQTQLALSRPRSSAEYVETIETVQRSAQRMQGLMESLLTLACLDAHSEPLQRQPCDLAVLAVEHLDLIRPLAQERGIPLHADCLPAVGGVDPDRIGQILDNLLTNAVKYSRPGDEVRVNTATENGSVIVRIADNGPGIAPEHLPHLFERFYRADRSRNRSTGGAGLGLAICKSLAEAHGGTIGVESEVGSGTVFTVKIPTGTAR